jgi:hypothetical protein
MLAFIIGNPKFEKLQLKLFREVVWLIVGFQVFYFGENFLNFIRGKNGEPEEVTARLQLAMHILVLAAYFCLVYIIKKT